MKPHAWWHAAVSMDSAYVYNEAICLYSLTVLQCMHEEDYYIVNGSTEDALAKVVTRDHGLTPLLVWQSQCYMWEISKGY